MDLSKLRARQGTRKLAGVEIPRQNRTSVAFRKASSADGGDHDGITGGNSHRICRASGGRVKRQDGGSTISEDSKKEAAKLRASEKASGRIAATLTGVGTGVALAGKNSPARPIGGMMAAAGVPFAVRSSRKGEEAERIEKGKVKPGEEDRKSGGPVKRAYGGNVKKRNMGGMIDASERRRQGPQLPVRQSKPPGDFVGSGHTRLSKGAASDAEANARQGGQGPAAADRMRKGFTQLEGTEDRKSGGKVKKDDK